MIENIIVSFFALLWYTMLVLWVTFIVKLYERLYPSEYKQNKQRIPEEKQRTVKKGSKKGKDYLA